jgi:hypothetical protein
MYAQRPSPIGAYPGATSASQPPSFTQPTTQEKPTSGFETRSKSFTSSAAAARTVRNQSGEAPEGLAAEAVAAIRAGMWQRGAHGGLGFERVLREAREQGGGVRAHLPYTFSATRCRVSSCDP